MEGNKSIQRSDEQRNLYNALVEAYESDKIILDIYVETVTLKRQEPMQTTSHMEEPSHLEFDTDRDWNKTVLAVNGSIQSWISELAKQADTRSSFNELIDTPLDFSNFLINRLKVDTLTPELLAGPTYELMKGSCKSLVELEYHLKEVFKAITDQLDWVNLEGQQYPHNLLKPLPLIPNNQGRRVIPFEHFINNDLEYLRGGAQAISLTKDETPEILKNFITCIENQMDHKVKTIRCDNGTNFKNRIMNKFCEIKGIRREFSVARTPQQNGVAERKNRKLIEAARTVLADSKLPTTFWAEAVNTASYV
uniref:Putative ribonuclease H-like domain-containing protein n=1 Tax=Tanacetum cinerariifolium TaxID=118510 RepID=A0A6L2J7W7_TANCI|nr:putative ribonuclease H-like domain-containing protein [Tanacetum cinerariifolium]